MLISYLQELRFEFDNGVEKPLWIFDNVGFAHEIELYSFLKKTTYLVE